MKTYLFTVPIAPGKTETWKKYVKEMTGPRNEEFRESRKRAGLTAEQVYLQKTPMGDLCVVMLSGDNPQKSLETFFTSTNPFDNWFREKILVECHNIDLTKSMPQNEHILDFYETPTREYVGSKKH